MKDLMLDWVEDHKGERQDGSWYVIEYAGPYGEEEGLSFRTEKEIDKYLWDRIVDDPSPLYPESVGDW